MSMGGGGGGIFPTICVEFCLVVSCNWNPNISIYCNAQLWLLCCWLYNDRQVKVLRAAFEQSAINANLRACLLSRRRFEGYRSYLMPLWLLLHWTIMCYESFSRYCWASHRYRGNCLEKINLEASHFDTVSYFISCYTCEKARFTQTPAVSTAVCTDENTCIMQ